jgi:hypothetical protein
MMNRPEFALPMQYQQSFNRYLRRGSMERRISVLFLALLSATCYAEDRQRTNDTPRYQIVSTSHGLHSIFRVDTVTGAVSYCYVVSDSSDFNVPATSVRCVPEAR